MDSLAYDTGSLCKVGNDFSTSRRGGDPVVRQARRRRLISSNLSRPLSAASPKCRVGAVRKTVVRTDSGSNDDIEDFDQASFQVVCRARIEPSISATSKHVGTPVVRHPLSYLVEPGGLEPPTPSLQRRCSPS